MGAPNGPLIIFDCDGVLVDSEPLACAVDAEVFTALGFPFTADEIASRFVGIGFGDMAAAVAREHGRALPNDVEAQVWATLGKRFRRELKPIAGVADLLAALPFPRCVASSSAPERIALSLEVTGLAPFFGSDVFSARQVARGKPAPDLFLFAAERMGHQPRDCIVVEDAPAGIAAAAAAGMTAIGFTGSGHAVPQSAGQLRAAGAQDVAADMAELAGVLQRTAAFRARH